MKNTLGGRLRVFIVGAAAANPEIVSDFKDLKLMTLQGYGLTEASPVVAAENVKPISSKKMMPLAFRFLMWNTKLIIRMQKVLAKFW